MIKHDIRQAICNLYFPVAVLVMVVFLLYGDYEDIFYGGSDGLLGMLQYSSTLSYVPYMIPIVAALPYAGALQEELRSGYGYSTLSRSSKTAYLRGKILTAMGSGAAVMLLASILFLIIAGNCTHYGFTIGGYEIFNHYGTLQSMIEGKQMILVLVIKIVLLSFYAAFWSLLSLVCVVMAKNQYLALAFPFFANLVIRYCVAYLHLFYLHPFYHTLSGYVLFPKAKMAGIPISVGYFIVSYFLLGWLFGKKMEDKWKNE
ncbi:MAG: hypothetical protein II838_09040 [Lachnospiraceae bacterium]|nr:hypothetical protein [Lachnospiraceae bacterium]